MASLAPTTRLEAVNVMLRALGQSPVSSLENNNDVTVSKAKATLEEYNREVQSLGWKFNTEEDYELVTDSNNKIAIPLDALQIDPDDNAKKYVQRGQFLYDTDNHTDTFTQNVKVTLVFYLDYETLPEIARRYIAIKAARAFFRRERKDPDQDTITAREEYEAKANADRMYARVADQTLLSTGTIRGHRRSPLRR